ncbi:MAG: PAS domain S-box protein, partial [Zoogloea sp.]|nr:PAS domain S-box protein [Zoogloea sp.]
MPATRAARIACVYALLAVTLIASVELLPAAEALRTHLSLLLAGATSVLLFVLLRREPADAHPAPAAISLPLHGDVSGAESETRFREVLDTVQHVQYRFNPEHECYDYISPRAEAWLGTSIETLCAPGGWQHFSQRISSEELGRIWARIGEALKTPGCDPVEISFEYQLDSDCSGPIWIRDQATLLRRPDGSLKAVVGAAFDQTAERTARENLRVTLRSMGEAVIATDEQSRITLMNPVAEALTGWNEDEARGQHLGAHFHIIDEETGEALECPAARALRERHKGTASKPTLLVDRGGMRRPIAHS